MMKKILLAVVILVISENVSAQQFLGLRKQEVFEQFLVLAARIDSARTNGSTVFNQYTGYDLQLDEKTQANLTFSLDDSEQVEKIVAEFRNIDSAQYFRDFYYPREDMEILDDRAIGDVFQVKARGKDGFTSFDILLVFTRSRNTVTATVAKSGMIREFNEWK